MSCGHEGRHEHHDCGCEGEEHRHGHHDCGCEGGEEHRHGHDNCGCGGEHHDCERHERRHECNCGCGCCCGRGGRSDGGGAHFQRGFQTRAERIAELEAYLGALQSEITAVEEHLAGLKASA